MNSGSSRNDFIAIGKIVGVHGLDGNLRVKSHSGLTASYDSGRRLFVKAADKNEGEFFSVSWAKSHKKGILIKFKGVDRQRAEELVGWEVHIKKSELPELEEDTYFWFDLIGLDVFTVDENFLGTIQSILPTGSNDVYVVTNKDKEILLPAISRVIKNIDLKERRMVVDLPEGL